MTIHPLRSLVLAFALLCPFAAVRAEEQDLATARQTLQESFGVTLVGYGGDAEDPKIFGAFDLELTRALHYGYPLTHASSTPVEQEAARQLLAEQKEVLWEMILKDMKVKHSLRLYERTVHVLEHAFAWKKLKLFWSYHSNYAASFLSLLELRARVNAAVLDPDGTLVSLKSTLATVNSRVDGHVGRLKKSVAKWNAEIEAVRKLQQN